MLYMLQGVKRNKRYNTMTEHNGCLYLDRTHNPRTSYQDGAVFLCLAAPEAPEITPDPSSEHYWKYCNARDNATVTFLTPGGNQCAVRIKGNKTKFRQVNRAPRGNK